LFTRSLNKLLTVDVGFQQEGILITEARFDRLNFTPERRLAFRGEVIERIKAIPGVDAVGDTSTVPLSGGGWSNAIWLEGGDPQKKVDTLLMAVGPDYFKTLRMPLLIGRGFDQRDAPNSPLVAIVSETFARQLLNGANPLGRLFRREATPGGPETVYQIIGLVRDSKYETLREDPSPVVFVASSQDPHTSVLDLLIHSNLPQTEITGAVRRTLGEFNPNIDVSFQGFRAMVEESVLRERLLATLSGFFGVLALLLASIGLYGILSYGVASRTKEIGIRMALGAQSREVLRLVLREALLLVLVGVGLGLPIVFAATRFASSLLFGLTPADPLSMSLAGLLLFAVAMMAAYLPARRATKVDPLIALRYE
jgi:predicted permease